MELADTSAWTNRHKNPSVLADFNDRVASGLIATCPVVLLELLYETRDVLEFEARRRRFEALPDVPIDSPIWTRATDVCQQLAADGPLHHRRVKLPDLLVAAAAESAGMPVVHYDPDFELIASVTGQPVRAIAPLGSL